MSNVISLQEYVKAAKERSEEDEIIAHYERIITFSGGVANSIIEPIEDFFGEETSIEENVDLQILQNLIYSLVQGFLFSQTIPDDMDAGPFAKFYTAVAAIYEMGYYNADTTLSIEAD